MSKASVVLFCGGRGCRSIITRLVDRDDVALTILVNGYDDGRSTGAVRRMVPGMLGPSDFRKNVAWLLAHGSRQDRLMSEILEYRIQGRTSIEDIVGLLSHKPPVGAVPLYHNIHALPKKILSHITEYVLLLRNHLNAGRDGVNFENFAFGNILFAGAYIRAGRRFNGMLEEIEAVFRPKARIVNVTDGSNGYLAALKMTGEIMDNEARIVDAQSTARIASVFLTRHPITDRTRREIETLSSLEEKREFIESIKTVPAISPAADGVLRRADTIVYGVGTQHSSLFPSYMTRGVRDAVQNSAARHKVLLTNIACDHDIQGWCAFDIVDAALAYLDDPKNSRTLVTHILVNDPATVSGGGLPVVSFGALPGRYKGALVVQSDFAESEGHHAERTVAEIVALTRTGRRDTVSAKSSHTGHGGRSSGLYAR
ncbi:MAG: 2-phospho-L-lactate transferase CofD family protein [Spirochaetales bacterium]|nr:2-phospho-L-lactate transferase CofD family protein [Spirochaetales bacterium]